MKLVPKRSKQFEVLRRMFLFDHVKMEVAESVFQSPICECFEFEQDEFIYTRNNFRRCMGLVVSGKVRAVKHAQEGDPAMFRQAVFQVRFAQSSTRRKAALFF